MKRDPLLLLILLTVFVICYLTLYPFQWSPVRSPILQWVPIATTGIWLDSLLNFYLFFPLGVLCGIRFQFKGSVLISIVACCLLSTSVEFTQAFLFNRYSTINDVFLNTLGAATGIQLANLPIFEQKLIPAWILFAVRHRAYGVMLALWACALYFPFMPRFGIYGLMYQLGDLNLETILRSNHVLVLCASMMVVLLMREYHSKQVTLYLTLALTTLIPFQLLVVNRNQTWASLLICLLGYQIGLALALSLEVIPHKVLAWASTGAILVLQLYPFQPHLNSTQPFAWIPFSSTMSINLAIGGRILAMKWFVYCYAIRQWSLYKQTPALKPALSIALVLFVTEWVQTLLPGRSPEITDSLLALLAGVPALTLEQKADQGL